MAYAQWWTGLEGADVDDVEHDPGITGAALIVLRRV